MTLTPTFSRAPHPTLEGSLYRSGGVAVESTVLDTETEGYVQLWWGPLVEVRRGMVLRYFWTDGGMVVEAVEDA